MNSGKTRRTKKVPESFVRQWRLVLALQARRQGASVRQLTQELRVTRQTLWRYLKTLEAAGVPIVAETVNGEARYRLMTSAELPKLGATPLQIAALQLARAELEPLAGTGMVQELDALLAQYRPAERQQHFQFTEAPARPPQILAALEQGLTRRRRVRIEYRAASRGGTPSIVHIEPLLLRLADRTPYVRAYCVERNAERTYKVARIASATVTEVAAEYRNSASASDPFERAVKAWSGELTQVKVRLGREQAWLAGEYPLVDDQVLEAQRDGSVIVTARVAGIVETLRWVLSWGGAAEALEPEALREAARAEHAKALIPYGGPKTAKAKAPRANGMSRHAATRGS